MAKRTPIHRRTFLRGAGAALSLPLLDAMAPLALAAGSAPASPVRLAWVFFANGCYPKNWTPTTEGADWEPTPTLQPLAPHRDDLLVLSGLAHRNAEPLGDGAGDHARSAATFLTGAHPKKTTGASLRAGASADQIAASLLGRHTRLPSLELGIERGRIGGSCDSGYACVYSNNISWRSPTRPAPKETNPRLAFERLFGGDASGARDARRRRADRLSLLDAVADQSRALRGRLGKNDREKLDEYFHSVRDVELRLERLGQLPRLEPPPGAEPPTDKPDNTREHIRLMYDVMALAFQTDATRIATFMLANEGSWRSYPMLGVRGGHHELSHHKGDPNSIDAIAKIDRFLVEEFARFLRRLKKTPDGPDGRTLLDNSLVMYGSAISDGNRHSHRDLPVLLAGRGGGVTPGRHARTPDGTPLTNLYVSMLNRAGAPTERIGDSTGPLAGLGV